MTESGFEMPPDHIVFQMLSTLALSSPVIMVGGGLGGGSPGGGQARSVYREMHERGELGVVGAHLDDSHSRLRGIESRSRRGNRNGVHFTSYFPNGAVRGMFPW